MKKHKILFLTHVGDPGGAEINMANLCQNTLFTSNVICLQKGSLENYLTQRNIKCEVLEASKNLTSFSKEDGLLSVIKTIPSLFGVSLKIARKTKNYDVLICMSQKSFFLTALSKIIHRKPIIWFMNDILEQNYFNPVLIQFIRVFSFLYADHIIVNSQASFEAWKKNAKFTHKVHILYPGINFKDFTNKLNDQDLIQTIQTSLNPDKKILIGIFGRLAEWKGQKLFVEALKNIPNVRGVIVGDALFGEDSYKNELLSFIKDNNLEDRITLTGHVDNVPAYMGACDIIVHFSTIPEPFGQVIVEAMATEKPVIAANAGGAKEIIQDGVTGLLAEPNNIPSLIDKINFYIENQKKAAAIALAGKDDAQKRFSIDVEIIDLHKILEKEIPTKVLFLSPVDYFKGGAERSLFDLLTNPDIEPILAVPAEGPIKEKAKELGIPCYLVPFGSINTIHRPFSFAKGFLAVADLIKAALTLKKIAKENNVRLVHSNGLKAHAINCTSRWLGGAKAIVHVRDTPYTSAEKLVWKILCYMADHVVLVSNACLPDYTLPSKTSVIYNGIPLIPFVPKQYREEYTIRLGFVGRIHPAKGLHLLLDWIKAAQDKNILCNLSVRGAFSDDVPAYEKEIQEQIARNASEHIVTFEGFIDTPEKVYKDLDCVVVPSDTPDPLPRSIMESMARGIPVLGYPAGGIPDMIEDGVTGFLVANETDFINALQKLTNDPKLLSEITKAAYEKIKSDFSMQALHNNLTCIYQEL